MSFLAGVGPSQSAYNANRGIYNANDYQPNNALASLSRTDTKDQSGNVNGAEAGAAGAGRDDGAGGRDEAGARGLRVEPSQTGDLPLRSGSGRSKRSQQGASGRDLAKNPGADTLFGFLGLTA